MIDKPGHKETIKFYKIIVSFFVTFVTFVRSYIKSDFIRHFIIHRSY